MTPQTSPVFAWQRQPTLTDHAGHLSALFFISGCNFQCKFCHNAGLMGQAKAGLSWQRLEEIVQSLSRNWVDSVTITGGEPLLNPHLGSLISWLKGKGLLIKLDTNGSYPDRLAQMLHQVDYIALDIKTCQAQYPALTGWPEPKRVLHSVQLLAASNVEYELRTTIIEAHHTNSVMNELLAEIHGCRRYVLQPFLPRPDLPELKFRTLPRTTPQRLQQLAEMAATHSDKVCLA